MSDASWHVWAREIETRSDALCVPGIDAPTAAEEWAKKQSAEADPYSALLGRRVLVACALVDPDECWIEHYYVEWTAVIDFWVEEVPHNE